MHTLTHQIWDNVHLFYSFHINFCPFIMIYISLLWVYQFSTSLHGKLHFSFSFHFTTKYFSPIEIYGTQTLSLDHTLSTWGFCRRHKVPTCIYWRLTTGLTIAVYPVCNTLIFSLQLQLQSWSVHWVVHCVNTKYPYVINFIVHVLSGKLYCFFSLRAWGTSFHRSLLFMVPRD